MEFAFERGALAASYWCITALWLGEFFIFPSQRYGEREEQSRSFWWIVASTLFALALSGTLYHFQITRFDEPVATALRWFGITTYGSGVLLRYWSAWSLGPWFSRHLQASPAQALVSRGPYRLLRHPLYSGLFLALTGTIVLMVNWAGILAGTPAIALAILHRMRSEETLLELRFGERYTRWSSTRYRLIPFIY